MLLEHWAHKMIEKISKIEEVNEKIQISRISKFINQSFNPFSWEWFRANRHEVVGLDQTTFFYNFKNTYLNLSKNLVMNTWVFLHPCFLFQFYSSLSSELYCFVVFISAYGKVLELNIVFISYFVYESGWKDTMKKMYQASLTEFGDENM